MIEEQEFDGDIRLGEDRLYFVHFELEKTGTVINEASMLLMSLSLNSFATFYLTLEFQSVIILFQNSVVKSLLGSIYLPVNEDLAVQSKSLDVAIE